MRRSMRITGIVVYALSVFSSAVAEDYVSKEDFQKLVGEFDKFKVKTEKLESENADLRGEIKTLRAGTGNSNLNDIVGHDVFDENMPKPIGSYAPKSGTTKMLLTGSTSTKFIAPQHGNSTFAAEFDPLFIWKMSDRLSFESEIVFGLDSGGTTVELEYANMIYFVNDYLTVQAGKLKSPFGLYNPRFDPLWINKFADAPSIYDDGADGLIPHQELGIMFSGAIEAWCDSKFRYSAFVSNGMSLSQTDPAGFGLLVGNDSDNNSGKGVGGRVGYVVIPGLEFGFSGAYSANTKDAHTHGKSVPGELYGVDLSFVREIKSICGTIDCKLEWVASRLGGANYTLNTTPDPTTVAFNHNNRNGGYAQAMYRPTLINQQWIKNLEFGFRYDRVNNPHITPGTPRDALFQRLSHDRVTLGLNYWLEPSTVLKFDYEHDSHNGRTIWMQWALGF